MERGGGGGNTRHSLIQQLVTSLAVKFYIFLSGGGQYSTLSHTAANYLSSYQVLYLSFWWGGNIRHSLIQQLVTLVSSSISIFLVGGGGGQYSTLSHTAVSYLSSYQVLYLSFWWGQYSTLSHTAVSYLFSYQVLYLSFWWGGNTRHSLIQQLVTFLAIKFYIYLSGGGNTRHSLIQQLVTFLAIKFYIYLSSGGQYSTLSHTAVSYLSSYQVLYLSFWWGGNTRHSLIQQLVTFLAIKFYIYLSGGGQYSTLSHTAVSYLSSYQVLYLSFWWGAILDTLSYSSWLPF